MESYHLVSQHAAALQHDIKVPGDKSISHRAIIFGSIASGITTIQGFLNAGDCMATMHAFRLMGVSIDGPVSDRVVVHGLGKRGLKQPGQILDCGNSGTSMRLLAGLLSAQPFDSELSGDSSLLKRPMERIRRPLSLMGAEIQANEGMPPLKIHGGKQLHGINYDIPIASAQVKSCLLLAGMYAEGETVITETGVTRDHTERMLTTFSYPVHKAGQQITISSEGECKAVDIIVPGDISSAAFFIVAACLVPESELLIHNVGINPTRTGIIHILQLMGADISILNKRLCGEEPVADLYVKYAALEGIDIPISMVALAIDEFPIIFIAAACAKGHTRLQGASELRFKESDRIGVMAEGLKTLGVDVQAFDDGIFIKGGQINGGVVDSHGDHRIAMAFAVAGAISKEPVTVKNCANINTSFPNFMELANQAGMNLCELTDD